MDNDVRRLTSFIDTRGGTSAERVADVQSELGVVLPEEYVAFLIETNGGAGPVGQHGWASFYSVNELVEMNAWYHDEPFEQFEGLALFGSDGGGEAFVRSRRHGRRGGVHLTQGRQHPDRAVQ